MNLKLNQKSLCFKLAQTLKRVEDAEEEQNNVRERSKVEEGQTPGGPEQAAEAPDAEESHAVLLPLVPGADLPVDHEEHHDARKRQDGHQGHVGAVVSQQSLVGILHPAPGIQSERDTVKNQEDE